jgi:hypothetical protein
MIAPPPPVGGPDYTLNVPTGFFSQQYEAAAQEALNPGNSVGARIGFGMLAVAAAKLAGAEELLNIPFTVENAGIGAGEHIGRAMLWAQQGDYAEAVAESLQSAEQFTQGFGAAAQAAAPVAGLIESNLSAASVEAVTAETASSLADEATAETAETASSLADEATAETAETASSLADEAPQIEKAAPIRVEQAAEAVPQPEKLPPPVPEQDPQTVAAERSTVLANRSFGMNFQTAVGSSLGATRDNSVLFSGAPINILTRPDFLSEVALVEVKANLQTDISYTTQIQAEINAAVGSGRTFVLVTQMQARASQPLIDAIRGANGIR